MIVLDTNILVYAHREELSKHNQAKAYLEELVAANRNWAIPIFCLGEFLRIITHPKLFNPYYTAEEGCEAIQRLLACPSLTILMPGDNFIGFFLEAVSESGAVGNIVFDAQIVALCREWNVETLVTEDRDFARFSGVEVVRL